MQKKTNPDQSPKKKSSLLLFFLFSSFLLFGLTFRIILPDTFSPVFIKHDIQGEFTPFNCPQIHQISSCKLRYLGEGMQSIAFASVDKKYVLKFFLTKRRYQKIRLRPAPFLQKMFSQKNKNRTPPSDKRYVLESYDKAFCKIKEETGLVAVHLSASSTEDLPFCHLIDDKGQEHVVDLNRVSFVVQKYGALVKDKFLHMSLKEQKEALIDLEKLLQKIATSGFINHGKSFNPENFALVDRKALMIDVGNIKFSEEQKADPKKEIQKLKKLLKNWKLYQ